MAIEFKARNLEVTEQARQHIEKKVGQVSRHLPRVSRSVVELSSESTRAQQHRIVAQVTLDMDGTILRAEDRGPNVTAAINGAVEALDRRIERFKGHVYRSQKARQVVPLRAQQAEEAAETPVLGDEDGMLPGGDLVRLKQFYMKPMTVEEAALQMQLLGHSFYMFLNSEVNQYNLLYRRQDGNYGLIQPKAA